MQAWLKVIHQRANLQQVRLLPVTLIGRSPECHLKIASSQVSRRHCQVSLRADGVYVEDLGSANGTFLDGLRLPASTPTYVRVGGELEIGPAKFAVEYHLTAPSGILQVGSIDPSSAEVDMIDEPDDAENAVTSTSLPAPSPGTPPADVQSSPDDAFDAAFADFLAPDSTADSAPIDREIPAQPDPETQAFVAPDDVPPVAPASSVKPAPLASPKKSFFGRFFGKAENLKAEEPEKPAAEHQFETQHFSAFPELEDDAFSEGGEFHAGDEEVVEQGGFVDEPLEDHELTAEEGSEYEEPAFSENADLDDDKTDEKSR